MLLGRKIIIYVDARMGQDDWKLVHQGCYLGATSRTCYKYVHAELYISPVSADESKADGQTRSPPPVSPFSPDGSDILKPNPHRSSLGAHSGQSCCPTLVNHPSTTTGLLQYSTTIYESHLLVKSRRSRLDPIPLAARYMARSC